MPARNTGPRSPARHPEPARDRVRNRPVVPLRRSGERFRIRCVSGVSWVPDVAGCPPAAGGRTPGVLVGPCRHCAGRQGPPHCPIASVLTVALSHRDGSGPPRSAAGGRPGTTRTAANRGIAAGAGAPRATRRKFRLSWHVSRTGATPHCDGCNRTTASTCPGRPGPRRQAGPQMTYSANSNVMGSSNPSLP